MADAGFDKVGVFVAGGPAAGINGVIKGIVQEATNAGARVVGFLDGARGLYFGNVMELTRTRVEHIEFLGGSILGTSRFDPRRSPDGFDRILATLRQEGVDGVISIGGEGTLQLAEVLRQRGVRIVHVPKTIDNDIYGVSQTFGFDTAVHEAARLLTTISLDAHTSATWFMVEIMGRYTGHLALEAGLASGATRVLIPEEGPIDVESLADLVAARQRIGIDWGVVVVAESAHFGEGYITRFGRLGGVAERLAERLDDTCRRRSLEVSIRFSNLGYFLRCAEPAIQAAAARHLLVRLVWRANLGLDLDRPTDLQWLVALPPRGRARALLATWGWQSAGARALPERAPIAPLPG